MKKYLTMFLMLIMCVSTSVFAEDITTNTSDDIQESYDETYDEGVNQDITAENYDEEEQFYDAEFDEREWGTEENVAFVPDGISVFVNGEQLEFDVEPMIINNRTMVPMRAIFEALGAEVTWDANTRTAIGETNEAIIKISIGKEYLLKNDNIIVLDSPAVIVDNRTFVPVRAIAESLDCKVEWYGEAQVVEILK
ncbi:MAG: copper amine oxidase N-terminal domain-containing protein [Clostridia bacterium]|nr:copper amine oxidase N-terminal domain-containing protein [Clostridia bacterium]